MKKHMLAELLNKVHSAVNAVKELEETVMATVSEDEWKTYLMSDKFFAVRLYRLKHNCTLFEAKKFVEGYLADLANKD